MDRIESFGTRNSRYARIFLFDALLDCVLYCVRDSLACFVRTQEGGQDHHVYRRGCCTGIQGIVGLDFAKKYGVGVSRSQGLWLCDGFLNGRH